MLAAYMFTKNTFVDNRRDPFFFQTSEVSAILTILQKSMKSSILEHLNGMFYFTFMFDLL